jgi:hypothetical protein
MCCTNQRESVASRSASLALYCNGSVWTYAHRAGWSPLDMPQASNKASARLTPQAPFDEAKILAQLDWVTETLANLSSEITRHDVPRSGETISFRERCSQ